ncbi:histidine phosphatase family protein [Thioalkalivibrio denitrificans]|uniref:Histidine phosphatase family protein n=1 Tax=Thioalkalivibrio denitrificans TaxID=108003 RepID=A0A1V3NDX6_9GAMM|nr:histidine phosphatase family protein [Thioalkalivibrio denitrificans]OOG23143.1 histidine phosphatase family protein [Thioalkalivibrio denitrificans]
MFWLCMVLVALSAWTTAAQADTLERDALLESLRDGGLVIYWRHAITDRSQRDRDFSDMTRCELQRNLSEAGRAQARAMGEALIALGVPLGEVISSPFCRNIDTAELAFGRYRIEEDLFNWPPAPPGRKPQLISALREMLATPPPDPDTNTVLVGHNLNIRQAADVRLEEGDMGIFQPLGDDGFRHLGNLTDRDLETLLRQR